MFTAQGMGNRGFYIVKEAFLYQVHDRWDISLFDRRNRLSLRVLNTVKTSHAFRKISVTGGCLVCLKIFSVPHRSNVCFRTGSLYTREAHTDDGGFEKNSPKFLHHRIGLFLHSP